jgi:hypothetical protein
MVTRVRRQLEKEGLEVVLSRKLRESPARMPFSMAKRGPLRDATLVERI